MGPYPVSTRLFWQIINKSRSQKSTKCVPDLKFDDKIYKVDSEKANLFSQLIGNIFKDDFNPNFDSVHKNFIQNENAKIKYKSDDFVIFNTNDIFRVLNRLKIGKSS